MSLDHQPVSPKIDLNGGGCRTLTLFYMTLPEKSCIICNQIKSRSDTKILRIIEARIASLFLSAIKFNKDEVFTRCILLGSPGDIFAAEHKNYHKNRLSNYLRKFEREVFEKI